MRSAVAFIIGALAIAALSSSDTNLATPQASGAPPGGCRGPQCKPRVFSQSWLTPRFNAAVAAWKAEYQAAPKVHGLALMLAVAACEGSGAVKGHPDLFAWGSVHSRKPTSTERLLLALLTPCRDNAEADALMRAQAGLDVGPRTYPDGGTEYLACDHANLEPGTPGEWTWFAAYATQDGAARRMLRAMNSRAVLDDPNSTPDDLATHMKHTYHYGVSVEDYAACLWPCYLGLAAQLKNAPDAA